jgi:DNA-binding beta-propeller fold protein YncE
MGTALSTRRNIPCPDSFSVCVVTKHGLFIVSDFNTNKLHVYSLIDGSLIRSIGSRGSGKGQFHFSCGGLCVSPDGDSVMVAEYHNNRVQELRVMDGSWVLFAGEGVLEYPRYVDCNDHVIVVSEACHRVSVLSWADDSLWAQFGSVGSGPGRLNGPRGIRLLAGGSGVVVVDCWNHRLCVFTLSGEFVAAVGSREQGLIFPFDVVEYPLDGSFIVTNFGCDDFVNMGRDGANVVVYGEKGEGDGEFCDPTALAALPNDGYLAMDADNRRVQQIVHRRARLAWMRGCASTYSIQRHRRGRNNI